MKKLSIVSASVLALAAFAVAVPAQAATVDLGVAANATRNVREGVTNQEAWAVDINVGEVVTSNIDMSSTNLVNTISNETLMTQVDGVPGLVNGALSINASLNRSLGAVDQLAVAGIGSGGLNNSSVAGAATNAVNTAVNGVTFKQ